MGVVGPSIFRLICVELHCLASLIIKENAPYNRAELVKLLTANGIECRPIVTGNFLKNKEVLEYFDYEVSGSLESAEYLDVNGLFVGNHQNDIESEIRLLSKVLSER